MSQVDPQFNKYQQAILDLARLVGLQKVLKKKRRIAQRNLQFKTVRKLEARVLKNRIQIRELHNDLVIMKVSRMMELALKKMVGQRPTARDVAKQLFKNQGLFLHENGDVSGEGGKLVGRVGDISVKDNQLTVVYQPIKALDHIIVDLKI